MSINKKLSIAGASFIALMLIYAVIPNSNNPFDIALEVVANSKNVDVSNIEILTAKHASVLITEEIQLKFIIDKKVYFATLSKIPFFDYKIKAMVES